MMYRKWSVPRPLLQNVNVYIVTSEGTTSFRELLSDVQRILHFCKVCCFFEIATDYAATKKGGYCITLTNHNYMPEHLPCHIIILQGLLVPGPLCIKSTSLQMLCLQGTSKLLLLSHVGTR